MTVIPIRHHRAVHTEFWWQVDCDCRTDGPWIIFSRRHEYTCARCGRVMRMEPA